MAVVLIEGFDHLTAAGMTAKGWSTAPNLMQPGRFGGQSARFSSSATHASKPLPSSYSTIFLGFAFFSTSLATGNDFAILRAGATNVCRLQLNGAGNLLVLNSGGTTIATGSANLLVNTWYYIEVKLVVNGASGSVEVHLNGAVEISSTAGNFGTTNIDTLQIGQGSNSGQFQYDDMYVCDTTGSAPQNTFLGDVRVATIYPAGDGAHTAWTPNTGTTHYTQVDEAQADDDTTYVSDATPGDLDTYTFGTIDTGATVYALQTNLYARKDDANTRQIAPVIRQSGTDNIGATVTLASTYVDYTQIYNQDPTSAAWTPTTVNADQYGVKEVA